MLTHLARNADGLRNLLIWARTGVVTPQYPSFEVRNEEIEAGAGRRRRASWLSISPTQRRPLRPRRPGSATATGPRRCAACEAQRIPPGTRSGGGCPNWKSTTSTWTPAHRPADWPADFARECLQGQPPASPAPTPPRRCCARQTTVASTASGRQARNQPSRSPASPMRCSRGCWVERRRRPERDANRPAATCSPVVVISLDILLALKDGYSRTSPGEEQLLRFTLRRPGNPVASACIHGMPCRDVASRVHVSVAGVVAGSAPEAGCGSRETSGPRTRTPSSAGWCTRV